MIDRRTKKDLNTIRCVAGMIAVGLTGIAGCAGLSETADNTSQSPKTKVSAEVATAWVDGLTKLVRATGELNAISVPERMIEKISNSRPSGAWQARGAEVYEYEARDRQGAAIRGRALIVPVKLKGETGSLVLYRNGEEPLKMRALGLPVIEQDWTGRWRAMLGQFAWKNGSATLESAPYEAKAEQLKEDALASIRAGDSAGQSRKLRLSMRENSARFSQLSLGDRSKVKNPVWLSEWAEHMGEVSAFGERVIEPLYGAAIAGQFVESANLGEQILAQAAEANQAGETERLSELLDSLYPSSCKGCHNIRTGSGDDTIYQDLPRRFEELGIRSDLFVVGVDVLGVPGMERESQIAADAAAVAILMWNALPE